eukprot:3927616-Amphidinium_carterae.1
MTRPWSCGLSCELHISLVLVTLTPLSFKNGSTPSVVLLTPRLPSPGIMTSWNDETYVTCH